MQIVKMDSFAGEEGPCVLWCGGSGRYDEIYGESQYDIPICPGCGGIGRIINTPEFHASAERIGALRNDPSPEETGSDQSRVSRIQALIANVQQHFLQYGKPGSSCYARLVAEDGLYPLLEYLRTQQALARLLPK